LEVCGLGVETEINPTQPPTSPCPPNIAWKDKEWSKDESK